MKNVFTTSKMSNNVGISLIQTPRQLANEMLSKIPQSVFDSKTTTFLDPCFGSGTFLIAIIDRLLAAGHSVDNINSRVFGIEKSRMAFNRFKRESSQNGFDLQLELANALEKDYEMKFDVVIGNPPYQDTVGSASAKPIWHQFHNVAFSLINENGYLCMIHPAGWRINKKTFVNVWNRVKENNLLFLQTSNYQTGGKLFGVGTTCDWYVLQKNTEYRGTVVRDVNGNVETINIHTLPFIPDSDITRLQKYLDTDNPVTLIANSSYHTSRNYVSKTQTAEFCYPVVYVTKKNTVDLRYSNTQSKGHYGIPKVIVSNGRSKPLIDRDGTYAMTEFAWAIVDTPENLDAIAAALENPELLAIFKTMAGSSNNGGTYTITAMRHLRKDFFKLF